MPEILNIKMRSHRVITEAGMGFGIDVTLEGVNLSDILGAVNTALNAKGSKKRIGIENPDKKLI